TYRKRRRNQGAIYCIFPQEKDSPLVAKGLVNLCPDMSIKLEQATQALTDTDRATYEWQIPVTGFGESGQKKLKAASVLISRCGGVGSVVAYELAAAGVGRLILAHAGAIKASDLNRQILMTHARIGSSRAECAAHRLRELNPDLTVEAAPENFSDVNAERLV